MESNLILIKKERERTDADGGVEHGSSALYLFFNKKGKTLQRERERESGLCFGTRKRRMKKKGNVTNLLLLSRCNCEKTEAAAAAGRAVRKTDGNISGFYERRKKLGTGRELLFSLMDEQVTHTLPIVQSHSICFVSTFFFPLPTGAL